MENFNTKYFFLSAVLIASSALTVSATGDCWKPDTKGNGNVVMTFWTGCASECQKKCEFHPNCKSWTYNPLAVIENDCSLHDADTSEWDGGMIFGPKRCGNRYGCELQGFSFNKKYRTNLVASKNITECWDQCKRTRGCHYSVFQPSEGGKCHFFRAGSILGLRENEDRETVLLPKDCNPEWCFVPGRVFNCKGKSENLGDSYQRDASACQKWCQEKKDCGAWSWNLKGKKRCYAKKMSCFGDYVTNDAGAVSGLRSCFSTQRCYDDKVEYLGNDVEVLPEVSTVEECASKCYGNPSCMYFTHKGEEKKCFLKDNRAPSQRKGHEKAISGASTCRGELPECVRRGYIYAGGDLTKKKVSSMHECADFCSEGRGCYFWNYDILDSMCQLKTGDASFSPTYVADRSISAPLGCLLNPLFGK